MAEKQVGKTKAGALPLLMSEKKKKQQQQQQARASPWSLLPAVRDVILWTLLNAGVVAFSLAVAAIMTSISQPPSWLLPGPVAEMTDAEEDVAGALVMLWAVCAAAQAAAGALALALPSHRRRLRLPLAYAALVATAAGHSMYAGLHRMVFAAQPGVLVLVAGLNTVAIFVFGAGDLLCFMGLILRGGE